MVGTKTSERAKSQWHRKVRSTELQGISRSGRETVVGSRGPMLKHWKKAAGSCANEEGRKGGGEAAAEALANGNCFAKLEKLGCLVCEVACSLNCSKPIGQAVFQR